MSKLEELIQELCPNGVKYKTIADVSTFRRGSFPQPYTNSAFYGGEGCMPFVQVADLSDDSFELKNKTKQTISKLAQPMSIFVEKGTILVSIQGTIGRVAITQYDSYVDRTIAIFKNNECLNKKFFAYVLKMKFDLEKKYARGSTLKTITKEEFSQFKVPVPPMEVQSEIVRILDNFTLLTAELTAELIARKQQFNYYFKKILSLKDTDYETMPLKSIGKVCMCKRIMKHQTSDSGDVPFYKIGTFGKVPDSFISKSLFEEYKNNYSYPKKGDILISCSGTIGRTVIFDGRDAYFQDSNIVWIDNDESIALNKYLFYVYKLNPFIISTGGTISRLYNSGIENAEIKVPSIEKQKEIISILDKFDTYCNDIAQGLPAEIELRKQQYEYYRDKLLTFKEL